MVNPNVSYSATGQRMHGMAINLKGFLSLCVKYNLSHPGEKAIRSALDRTCLGSAKQYFLKTCLVGKRTTMGTRACQECKAAICLPNQLVPEKCEHYFKTGTFC